MIDWTKLITVEMKEQADYNLLVSAVEQEVKEKRSHAEYMIRPLQDAVDIDEATEADLSLLKLWKKYRVALSKVEAQAGYPAVIDWPVPPA
ncbi:tail fiber assembly protein [Pseudomonas sp. BC115LW]|uniref:tail fiber assembly protein n=1 Tax=Pseudomonas sp. BC115LW TaxID=2683267 RepID=UPI001413379C|nr:tail fiber assembly protein [Pseudomonas sp. BC115LW]NBB33087.1 phage tail protein [Pseudomonas sp. BC115LW]